MVTPSKTMNPTRCVMPEAASEAMPGAMSEYVVFLAVRTWLQRTPLTILEAYGIQRHPGEARTMNDVIAGVEIPDTALVREATELVREVASPLLFDHSRRVFLWGALRGREQGLDYDPELLYVAAMFHDLGLTEKFRRTDQRFEIDGADEARRFLSAHGITGEPADRVWASIALHTTQEIPLHMSAEIALVNRGVGLDVVGIGYDAVSDEQRAAVVAAHPRPDFKNGILAAFTEGIKDRPETTFGNIKADVLAHFVPGFVRGDFVERIKNSNWPE
jgi:hypothetical protein